MSWDEAFADDYERWSAHMTADVAFYVELARKADGPLVELAVGNGRVAIPVAQATGRRIIGIDSSPRMLDQARIRAAEAGVELDLREGDMRDLALTEPAALVYCPARALLHLPPWADRRRTFERVAASLCPAGRFAWNVLAFDHRIAARLDGQHQENPRTAHGPVRRRRQPDRHHPRRRRHEPAVVGNEERVARARRRRRPRSGVPRRWLRGRAVHRRQPGIRIRRPPQASEQRSMTVTTPPRFSYRSSAGTSGPWRRSTRGTSGCSATSALEVRHDGRVSVRVRVADAADGPFLTEMLVEAAYWRLDGPRGDAKEVLADPALAHYVSGWPQPGDLGVIAEDEAPVGAAWLRLFTPESPGYGFVDDRTPELSMGVHVDRRGRGSVRRAVDPDPDSRRGTGEPER